MNNIKNFNDWLNEGIKDKLKLRWEKFKDELHPWDFTEDEWNEKWGDKKSDKTKYNKPIVKNKNSPDFDPFGEEDWGNNDDQNLPRNPYTIREFNEMIRNDRIRKTTISDADFVWIYKNGKIVYFKKNN